MTRTAGSTTRRRLADSLDSEYLHVLAPRPRANTRTLVVVHGYGRETEAVLGAFVPWAARSGVNLIAPVFSIERHRGYQRLRTSERGRYADQVLEEMLADAGIGRRDSICLFGFSGGAQFAHRFALLRPERVAALSIASAGWYTLPDRHHRFPYGIAPGSFPGHRNAQLNGLLSVPIQVLVGERDTERGESLRCDRRIDRRQGPNRVTRAVAWIESLRRLAPEGGPPQLEILPDAGHGFEHCVRAGLVERTTQWIESYLDDRAGHTSRRRSSQSLPENSHETIAGH